MTEYLRSRRRGAQLRDQRGFALAATLAILGLTSLVIIALLELTLGTTTISNDQVLRAKQGRAADGAMESAVNQIVRDTTGDLAAYGPPSCQPVQDMTIETVTVRVQCESITSELPPVPTGKKTTDVVRVVGNSYRGDPLSPDSAPNKWAELPATCILGSACMPWVEAFGSRVASDYSTGNPAKLSATGATVIATGGEALWVIGDVAVRKGSASLRNSQRTCPSGQTCPPTVPDYVDNGPAFGASGEYTQGDPGMFDSLTPSAPFDCGILVKNNEWTVDGTQVVGNDGVTCSSPTAAALNAAHPTVPAAPYDWTTSRIATEARAVPAFCPASKLVTFQPGAYDKTQTRIMNAWFARGDCDNKVFYFPPGNYWFDVDVATSLPDQQAAWRHELRFNDSTSIFLFGSPTGGDPNAVTRDMRPMCNQATAGVSVTFSARTTVRHTAGRVAVCSGNDHSVAIYQAKAINLGWEATPTTVTGGSTAGSCPDLVSCFVQNAVNWIVGLFGSSIAWTEPWQGYGQWNDASCINLNIFTGAQCQVGASLAFSGLSGNGDVIGAPINSATVVIDGDVSEPLIVLSRKTRIDVYPPGSTTPLCSVTYPGVPDGNTQASFELITNDPALATPNIRMCGADERPGLPVLRDRLQLYDSKIVVTVGEQTIIGAAFAIKINSFKLRTAWTPTSTAVTVSSGASLGGGFVGRVHVPCYVKWEFWLGFIPYPTFFCTTTGSGTFTVQNLASSDTFQSSITNPKLTSLGVTTSGSFYGQYPFFTGTALGQSSSYTVQVLEANGTTVVCTNRYDNLATGWDGRESRYLNLMSFESSPPHSGGGSGDCPSKLTGWTSSNLVGKSVRVKLDLGFPTAGACLIALGLANCDYGYNLNVLKVSSTLGDCHTIRPTCGSTVATAYNGPPTPFRVTSNNQATIETNPGVPGSPKQPNTLEAAFNVYGNVSIPRMDLDLRWAGPYTPDPIVTGSMWVNAIGSDIKIDTRAGALKPVVGVLCCVPGRPSERVVKLKAWVGNKLRGVAIIHISDVKVSVNEVGDGSGCELTSDCDGMWKPGQSTRVELWQLCNNNAEDPNDKQCLRT